MKLRVKILRKTQMMLLIALMALISLAAMLLMPVSAVALDSACESEETPSEVLIENADSIQSSAGEPAAVEPVHDAETEEPPEIDLPEMELVEEAIEMDYPCEGKGAQETAEEAEPAFVQSTEGGETNSNAEPGDKTTVEFLFDENGDRYYIDPETGERCLDWLEVNGDWYYFGGDGKLRTGWTLSSGGNLYYFDEDTGVMYRGWIKRGSDTYYMKHNGMPQTYWLEQDGDWYYFGSDGRMRTGWTLSSGGNLYYFDEDTGIMHRGWIKRGSDTYYMKHNGMPQTYWLELDGLWYYFGRNGVMRTGWVYVGNEYYYLYKKNDPSGGPVGANAHDVTINGRTLLSNGAVANGPKVHMEDLAQDFASATKNLIIVDTSACKIGVFYGSYKNWKIVRYWDCAPGAAATPTVKGTFTIGTRGYYFNSDPSRCYYYTQFYGNYLFHSVLYDQSGYTSASHINDGRVGLPLSHGCVRLLIDNAYWIYKYIPYGTKVYVF